MRWICPGGILLDLKNKLYIGIALLLLASLFFIGQFPCGVRALTGFPCASCGMTRAYKALAAGNLSLAFQMHPLFWLVPAIVILCYFKRGLLTNKWFWIAVAALLVVTYIIRMALFFPDQEPMTYYEQNLLQTLWKGFIK